jgi:hypothetical protein
MGGRRGSEAGGPLVPDSARSKEVGIATETLPDEGRAAVGRPGVRRRITPIAEVRIRGRNGDQAELLLRGSLAGVGNATAQRGAGE